MMTFNVLTNMSLYLAYPAATGDHAYPVTHKWQKDRHEAAKLAHIAPQQYFINITEEQCEAD